MGCRNGFLGCDKGASVRLHCPNRRFCTHGTPRRCNQASLDPADPGASPLLIANHISWLIAPLCRDTGKSAGQHEYRALRHVEKCVNEKGGTGDDQTQGVHTTPWHESATHGEKVRYEDQTNLSESTTRYGAARMRRGYSAPRVGGISDTFPPPAGHDEGLSAGRRPRSMLWDQWVRLAGRHLLARWRAVSVRHPQGMPLQSSTYGSNPPH